MRICKLTYCLFDGAVRRRVSVYVQIVPKQDRTTEIAKYVNFYGNKRSQKYEVSQICDFGETRTACQEVSLFMG